MNDSFINKIMENGQTPIMYIGMGVTEYLWSDRHAWEIIGIKDDKHITIRRYRTELKDGADWLDQEYTFFSDENEEVIDLFKSKCGWRQKCGRKLGDIKFSVGYASEYSDPSF